MYEITNEQIAPMLGAACVIIILIAACGFILKDAFEQRDLVEALSRQGGLANGNEPFSFTMADGSRVEVDRARNLITVNGWQWRVEKSPSRPSGMVSLGTIAPASSRRPVHGGRIG